MSADWRTPSPDLPVLRRPVRKIATQRSWWQRYRDRRLERAQHVLGGIVGDRYGQ